ncbi:MAG: hypothetical protein HWE18_12135 [Gammaproteobacteria bacterium]|nr:hypothetical protein [Gammaproteobacteria bacterium]
MKNVIVLCAILCALAAQASAAALTSKEGKIVFSKGEYQLISGEKASKLIGLTNQQLRQYEGRTVKVAVDDTDRGLEVYKVFVKTPDGYEASYDWDVVNQDLYAD